MKTVLSEVHERSRVLSARRRGFTLVELVVSMSVIAVLMAGMTTAVFITTKAMGDDTSSRAQTTEAADLLARITADLNYATSFSERTSKAITIEVPDRNGDSIPEVIRYAWSGNPGDPLTYEYNNSGTPTAIVEDVYEFDLSYLLATLNPLVLEGTESDEMLLIMHDNGPNKYQATFTVNSANWCAQCFYPTFPEDTIAWKITRVLFVAKKSGVKVKKAPPRINFIQIRSADAGGRPTPSVMEQAILPQYYLTNTLFWFQVWYSTLSDLDPETGMCLVIEGQGPATSEILFESGGSPMTPDTHFVSTSDSGASWTTPDDQVDMIFIVFGTVTTVD